VRNCGEEWRAVRAKAVLSNAISKTRSSGSRSGELPEEYVAAAQAVRINSSSCQVYLGFEGESIPHIGDLVFTSANQNSAAMS